jgi:hypothetical protein
MSVTLGYREGVEGEECPQQGRTPEELRSGLTPTQIYHNTYPSMSFYIIYIYYINLCYDNRPCPNTPLSHTHLSDTVCTSDSPCFIPTMYYSKTIDQDEKHLKSMRCSALGLDRLSDAIETYLLWGDSNSRKE